MDDDPIEILLAGDVHLTYATPEPADKGVAVRSTEFPELTGAGQDLAAALRDLARNAHTQARTNPVLRGRVSEAARKYRV